MAVKQEKSLSVGSSPGCPFILLHFSLPIFAWDLIRVPVHWDEFDYQGCNRLKWGTFHFSSDGYENSACFLCYKEIPMFHSESDGKLPNPVVLSITQLTGNTACKWRIVLYHCHADDVVLWNITTTTACDCVEVTMCIQAHVKLFIQGQSRIIINLAL